MKKADKINLLKSSTGTYNLCRCYFNYDPNYWYFYILDLSENLILGIEEDDFILNGFQIRKISDLRKFEIKDDICHKINQENNLLDDIKKPKINLSSWKTVFESLKPLNAFVIVENEKNDGFFYIGYITEIAKSFILFSHVDASGEWYENIKIPYTDITSVTFNDRYSKTWQNYLSKQNLMP